MSDTLGIDAAKFEEVAARFDAGDAAALPRALLSLQAACRYVPAAGVAAICRRLGVPMSRAFSVATFHRTFSLVPKGEVVIRVCAGAACHARGAMDLVSELCGKLGIREGGTTKDLKFTVETMGCVGACAMAPVVSVNGDLTGNVEPGSMTKTVEQVRA